jgi:hypothetical protein
MSSLIYISFINVKLFLFMTTLRRRENSRIFFIHEFSLHSSNQKSILIILNVHLFQRRIVYNNSERSIVPMEIGDTFIIHHYFEYNNQ